VSSKRRTTTAKAVELGEITFDDWYETPVFDTDRDERLEHLATAKQRPLRVVGAALLRLVPDRGRGDTEPEPAAPPSGLTARERWEALLDRWAAAETAAQERLESVVLPKRWRV
jgi:hypothetical protein